MQTLRTILGWIWRTFVQAFFAILALVTIIGIWGYTSTMAILQHTPELDFTRLKLKQSVRILDRRDGDLYRFYDEEDRFYLPGDKIPQLVKNAFVAIEDERFFTRKTCIDFRAIARAVQVNLFEDRTEGASTITQQLVRNLYLTREKTVERKLKEIDLACQLEQALSKEEILTIYLNQLPFGNNAFGIEQAAQTYFGKSATDISLAQASVLAAIPQRNSYFNPYGTHDRTALDHDIVRQLRKGTLRPQDITADDVRVGLLSRIQQTPNGKIRIPGRAETVLDSMLRNHLIDQVAYAEAVKELPKISFKAIKHPISAPHFTLRVRQEIDSLLTTGLDQPDLWLTEGMEVHTTLDPVLQWIAEDVTDQALPRLNGVGIQNIALVAIDRKTRQVLAYVGNADYFGDGGTGQIDMAATPRQPGSSFKPIVYSALFEDGYGPDSFIEDAPLRIGSNQPKNYDGGYRGWMSVRKALGGSRNIPAINAFLTVGGEERILDLAARMGVTSPLSYKLQQQLKGRADFMYGWPLAIGAAEVPLIEMVQAYASIAEHGTYRPLQTICKLTTRNGNYERTVPSGPVVQAVLPNAADGVDEILRDDDSKPDGYWRQILNIPGMDVGAKTGTSNLCFARDQGGRCREYAVSNIWTIGYNEEMVVGVWAGNADGAPLGELVDGLTEAAPIWREFLIRASQFYTSQDHC